MSFDQRKVGLPELYGQTRVKTIDNLATAAGATIRGNGVNPIVADLAIAQPASPAFCIRAIVSNGGVAGAAETPVKVYIRSSPGVINSVKVKGAGGTIIGASPVALAADTFSEITVLPGTGGLVYLVVDLSAAQNGVGVVILAGQDMVNTTVDVTNPH